MELSGDWSHCSEIWQKSTDDECPLQNCANSTCSGEEGSKISSSITVEMSKTSSDVSVVKDTCPIFASTCDGFVYKRRRLRRNTLTLLSEETAIDCDEGLDGSNAGLTSTFHPLTVQKNAIHPALAFKERGFSRNSSFSMQNHLQKPLDILRPQINEADNLASFLETVLKNRILDKEVTLLAEASVSNHFKSASEHCSLMNTSSSSSKTNIGQDFAVMKAQMDCGECSSSDVMATEPFDEFASVKELCISVLKSHGLLVGVKTTSACAPLEYLGANDANISRSCKMCNLLENPLKMLICDLCEEAFHVSCCHPKVKKIPIDYWYCQPCFKRRPNALLEKSSRKSANILSKHIHRKSYGKGGPILNMLRDNEPYASVIRIGKAFQVEVPQWTGSISEESNYFDVHLEVDLADGSSLDVPEAETPSMFSCICNWIQCHAVTYKNKKGTICGKWRRAPLFVVQTDDWDCSCSVLWDPIHADCAVPQELETDIILEHLKYVEMLRGRFAILQADT